MGIILMRLFSWFLMRFRFYQIHIFCLLCLMNCSHMGDWAKRVDWKELEFENVPGQEEYPDAPAIILFDEGKMEIYDVGEEGLSVFEQHRIVKILNSRGHRYLNIAIPYSPDTKVDHIQARTISPNGKITILNEEEVYDITFYPFFVFYSDKRAKLFTLPAVEDGSIIEYRYRVNIRTYTFWHAWYFQDTAPTLFSRFKLEWPSEWEVHYRMYGLDLEPEMDESPPTFKNTYIWEARDVPPIKTEFGMPPLHKRAARLSLAPLGINAWDDVSWWYHRMSEPRIEAGEGVKTLAARLTAGMDSDEEKLRHIYDWVRDNIRYIAVSIGIGGFQPHPAEEILKNRYGDCKDMTTLLCSLAREAGIDAHEVLVSTWQNGKPDTTLASQLVFNHAIAHCPTVGDAGIWMDGTAKGCPFGRLPWYDQGLPVLVVGEEGTASLPITPQLPPDSNRTLIDWHVTLESMGSARIEGTSVIHGSPAVELREEFIYSSEEDREEWLEAWLAQRCPGVVLDDFKITGIDPVADPLRIAYAFHTHHFALDRPEEMAFCPGDAAPFGLPDYFRSEERVHPIQFRHGFRNELRLTVELPDGWKVTEPSLSDSLISHFGSATWEWFIDDDGFHVKSMIRLIGRDIMPEAYREFRDFIDEKQVRDLRQVVLRKQ